MELPDIQAEKKKKGGKKGHEENVGHEIINTGDGNQLINETNPEESQNKNSTKLREDVYKCVNFWVMVKIA